ncbi:hypothetical protein HKD37_11G030786 [Glycine soja]
MEFSASKKIVRKYSREKWTQAYDGGKRYGYMTTNFVECMNFALKGAHTLPIIVSVKATFERIKACSVERGMHVSSMLHVGHGYPKKALRLPCSHVIAICSSCHQQTDLFVDLTYKLHTIYKIYELQFHSLGNKDYWSQYMDPNFVPNLDKR